MDYDETSLPDRPPSRSDSSAPAKIPVETNAVTPLVKGGRLGRSAAKRGDFSSTSNPTSPRTKPARHTRKLRLSMDQNLQASALGEILERNFLDDVQAEQPLEAQVIDEAALTGVDG